MEKTFNPSAIETHWYKTWEENSYFSPAAESSSDDAYCVMIPPPNVTGSLHMGHAFQHTIMDALIRYQRMRGKQTLWQVGTDHAGIATQMVVERKLAAEQNQTKEDLGREAFIDKIWEWKAESGGTITKQMRRLGNSVDWPTERFTMDEGFSAAVQQAFIRLYEEGLLYRGKRLVNWDPKLKTAISDIEVENRESKGKMWELRYPLADGAKTKDGEDYIVVATTRPETMLGDTGVAVNPQDPRFKHLIGSKVRLPLVDRLIPILGDEHADIDKGTGCVKITPAHDFNDYAVGQRHQLLMINVLDLTGHIRQKAEIFDHQGRDSDAYDTVLPDAFTGLERFAARKAIVAEMEALGLLDSIKDHQLSVPYGDRGGVVIEPMLTSQWYVDAKTLAQPAIKAVENGDVTFVPKQYENMYFAWMRDIQDWCISRQLWWGHRIPAWYDNDGSVYVGKSEEEVRATHNLSSEVTLTQDADVLDTWFSSGLWTFGTLGWPENTERLKLFHPTSTLVTGFDIIFFWVARMMMLSMHFMKDENDKPQIPFKTIYMTGLIRDEQGQKMSKSKGNVIDPLDMIDGISLEALLQKRTSNMMQPQLRDKIKKRTEKEFPAGIAAHGTDALRFTLTSLATTGRDINWDMSRLEGYRNFCNKLWNAARYVLMNCDGHDCGHANSEVELSLADQWIKSQLQLATEEIIGHFENYRFDRASQALYEFIWNEYCDWYLELSKSVLQDEGASESQLRGTRQTLIQVLESILRLAHPIMPFITEEIWQSIYKTAGKVPEEKTIMLQSYPEPQADQRHEKATEIIEWVKAVTVALRTIRGELNIAPSKPLPLLIKNASALDKKKMDATKGLISSLAKLDSVTHIDGGEVPASATQLVGEMELLVPLAGLIDVSAEVERLEKEILKLRKDIDRVNNKLGNEKFVANAPAEVVAKEKEKIAAGQAALITLEEKKASLLDLD